MKQKTSRESWAINMVIIISILLMVVLQFAPITYAQDSFISDTVKNTLMRFLGGMVFVVIIYELGYKVLRVDNTPLYKALLIALPALVVSIYNFPFIAYFSGTAFIRMSSTAVVWFALECLSIGFFEEILFRGLILVYIIKKMPQTKEGMFYAIVISSLLFSLMHVLNIFSSMSAFDIVLQIGYSFLMGMMWSVVLLKTKNIWITVVLHAIYNFAGLVFFTLGTITGNADIITIITTSIIAIFVAYYMVRLLLSIDPKEVETI